MYQAVHLDFVGEHVGVLLHDEVDVTQRHILDLRLLTEKRDERGAQLLDQQLLLRIV
jgi:hypothetical protein